MLSFTDSELKILHDAARVIPVDRRSTFIERVAAMRKFRPKSDEDLKQIVELASVGLAPTVGHIARR